MFTGKESCLPCSYMAAVNHVENVCSVVFYRAVGFVVCEGLVLLYMEIYNENPGPKWCFCPNSKNTGEDFINTKL